MLDLKKKLIEEIEKIEDSLVLEQLTQLVIQSNQNIEIQFSKEQINQIRESQIQIAKGEATSHEDVMKIFEGE